MTLYLGDEGLEDALRNVFTADLQELMDLSRGRRIIPGMCWTDEAVTAGLFSTAETRGLATLRGFGMGMGFVLQTLPMEEPQLLTDLLQNTHEKFLFLQGDPRSADLGASIFRPLLDSHKVHHYVTRQRNSGFTEERKVSYTINVEDDEIEKETRSTQFLPNLTDYEEPIFQSLSDGQIELSANLMSDDVMPVGTCYAVRRGFGIQRLHLPDWEDTWQFDADLTHRKFLEIATRLQSQLMEPIWEETRTSNLASDAINSCSTSASGMQQRSQRGKPGKKVNGTKKSPSRRKRPVQES